MAQRTTKALVMGVLTGDYDSAGKPDLQPFITIAIGIVDRVVAFSVRKGVSLTDSITLADATTTTAAAVIETWLAAHFYKHARDKALASKSTGGASGNYQGQTEMYLEGTYYGQNAMSADPSGCLQAIAMGAQSKRVFGAWLGKRRSTQTDYADRS